MSKNNSEYKLGSLIIALLCFFPHFVKAQITPDATLPNNSQTISDDKTVIIESGTTRGNNLFHSFEQFSVPSESTAFFNNAPSIQNIFSRVTGNTTSNIDGLIRANGTANLFFINPNGIIFGSNSRLDIGGSFLGSTANSILFTDGFEFSAKNPSNSPLLTVSVPIGLRLASPGNIEFQGIGHSLVDSPFFSFRGRNPSNSFQVQPGQSLALIGGDLTLSGAAMTAEGGKIELGSVDNGLVLFNPIAHGWTFDYKEVSGFRNIELASKSLVDTSGFGSGSIQIQGANVSLTSGSIALIQNQDFQSGGSLRVNATESLKITGIAPDRLTLSGLNTETIGIGQGANIIISSPQVIVEEGNISTSSYSPGEGGSVSLSAQDLNITNGGTIGTSAADGGKGGNLDIKVFETIKVKGVSPIFPDAFSAIASNTRGRGSGGEISVSARNLEISDRGAIGTNAISNIGKGGNVAIKISDSVKIIGGAGFATPSALTSSTFSPGNAGILTLDTAKLVIQDGAAITASTFGNGTAGDLQIDASDSIEIEGGSISSSAEKPPESLRQLLNLSSEVKGSSGNITIDTPDLKFRDGSQVTVRNSGDGRAGTLKIYANSVQLDNQAGITASTQSGQGGNITINSDNLLLMRRNSQISTSAGNAQAGGDGGQINIVTKFLVAPPLENSDITANAFEGKGGNVNITASAIFGFVPRSLEELQTLLGTDNPNELDPARLLSNDITAISQTNPFLSGQVTFNTPNVDPGNGLVELPAQLTDISNLIAQGCSETVGPQASKFIITGRGGLPEDPGKPLNGETIWTDLRFIATEKQSSSPAATIQSDNSTTPVIEASGLEINSKGEAVLSAAAPSANLEVPWLKPSSCNV